jgi:glutamine cyclotransferase
MNLSCRIWCSALVLLVAAGCAEDEPEVDPTCAPYCANPAQTGDAGSVPRDASSNPAMAAADGAVASPGQPDAGGGVPSDAGPMRDARPVTQDAASPRETDASRPLPEGGPVNTSDAAAPGADAGEPPSECEGPKARSGEPCADDTECGAGLLCDATSDTCRAISGIELVSSFSPSGRGDAYSEGLDFAHGSLWQSTANELYRIDVSARAVIASYPAPSDYSEGLTWSGNVLYNAAYRNTNLYAAELMGDRLMFKVIGQLQMTGGCTYGIVDHCGELFTTRCGRSVVDVYKSGTTMPVLRTFTVRDTRGNPLLEVEDLEIYRGQLWTSTFNNRNYASTLFRIDMTTNQAVASYEIPCETLAIDGVAADPATRTLYVTGKDCPIFVYRVQ